MLSGNNGILQIATEAKDLTVEKQIAERIQFAYTTAVADGNGVLIETNLRTELTKEFGDNYSLTEDITDNKWVISVDEIERLRVDVGLKSDNVEIVYKITKNTISINFKSVTQKYEELVEKHMKIILKDDIESQFPGKEVTISLIYQLWGVNSLEEAISKFGFSSVQSMLIDFGVTQEEINNIKETTGKIILKKGNTIIIEKNVSEDNDLVYNLTESGEYIIIGETSEGGKTTKNFEHQYDNTISFDLDSGIINTYDAREGITFRQWIEEYQPVSRWNTLWKVNGQRISCDPNNENSITYNNSEFEYVKPDDTIIDGHIYFVVMD